MSMKKLSGPIGDALNRTIGNPHALRVARSEHAQKLWADRGRIRHLSKKLKRLKEIDAAQKEMAHLRAATEAKNSLIDSVMKKTQKAPSSPKWETVREIELDKVGFVVGFDRSRVV